MKIFFIIVFFAPLFVCAQEKMMYGNESRKGIPFSKVPHVVKFADRYLMYYSIPPFTDESSLVKGWSIGIAESNNLITWQKIGEVVPEEVYESKGLCAPCAIIMEDNVHLFYRTYGNGVNDAICHAVSADGISFKRNNTNPVFKPTGHWNCARAIDAEVIQYKNNFLLYFATRDKDFKTQMPGLAASSVNTRFTREE